MPISDLFQLNLKAFRFRYPTLILPFEKMDIQMAISGFEFKSLPQISLKSNRFILVLPSLNYLQSAYLACLKNNQSGVILIEPSLEKIVSVLYRYDCREWILSPNVFWVLGTNWQDHLLEVIRSEGFFQFPPTAFQFISYPQEPHRIKTIQALMQRAIQTEREHFSKALKTFYQLRKVIREDAFPRVWAHIEPSAPIYRGLTEAFLNGFASQGCSVQCSYIARGCNVREKLLSELVEFSPDLIFLMNGPAASRLHSLGIPNSIIHKMAVEKLTWYVDHPHFVSSDLAASLSDSVAVCDRSYLPYFEPYNPRCLFHLPPSTSLQSEGGWREEFAFPILYVGSVINPNEYIQSLSKPAKTYLETLLQSFLLKNVKDELVGEDHQYEYDELIQCALAFNQNRLNKQFQCRKTSLLYFLYVIATSRRRVNIANLLFPLGLHIFGPDDWISFVDDKYKNRIHGLVESENLADCYASASININLHSLQCPTSLNIRDFDIPFAGGFLLSDWVEDFERGILQPEDHACIFKNNNELLEKTEYYLHEAEERKQIVERGRQWIKSNHTPAHRAMEVMKQLSICLIGRK